jgi:hypothetical protein
MHFCGHLLCIARQATQVHLIISREGTPAVCSLSAVCSLPAELFQPLAPTFSPRCAASPADMFILNATSGTAAAPGWQLVDAYAPGFVRPVPDKQQDTKLLGISSGSNGTLLAAWQRHVAPCDAQDLPLPPTPIHVLWAYGASWGYHGTVNRGSSLVSFLDQQQQQNQPQLQQQKKDAVAVTAASGPPAAAAAGGGVSGLPPGVQVLELTYPVDVPTDTTTYFVQYFKLPSNK